jgi:hypothetical protein
MVVDYGAMTYFRPVGRRANTRKYAKVKTIKEYDKVKILSYFRSAGYDKVVILSYFRLVPCKAKKRQSGDFCAKLRYGTNQPQWQNPFLYDSFPHDITNIMFFLT